MKPICGSRGFAGPSGCILDAGHEGVHQYGDTVTELARREKSYVKDLEKQVMDKDDLLKKSLADWKSVNDLIYAAGAPLGGSNYFFIRSACCDNIRIIEEVLK
jgi:hypothetical protein